MNTRSANVIEGRVRDLLESLKISSPPVDPISVAKALGVRVVSSEGESHLSGFLVRDASNGTTTIGVNKTHPHLRRRFTIAHELGHYVLGHQGNSIHVDENTSFEVLNRSDQSSDGKKPEEIEANRFAASLLMPANLVNAAINDETVSGDFHAEHLIALLARKFKVSKTAMTFRLANLGHIRL